MFLISLILITGDVLFFLHLPHPFRCNMVSPKDPEASLTLYKKITWSSYDKITYFNELKQCNNIRNFQLFVIANSTIFFK